MTSRLDEYTDQSGSSLRAVIRYPCATLAPGPWLTFAEDPVSLTTAFLVGLNLLTACSCSPPYLQIATHFPWFAAPGATFPDSDYNKTKTTLDTKAKSFFRTNPSHELRLSRYIPEVKARSPCVGSIP